MSYSSGYHGTGHNTANGVKRRKLPMTSNHTLTPSAFRSLIQVVTSSMKDAASFDPLTQQPSELREKYLPLYEKITQICMTDKKNPISMTEGGYLFAVKVGEFDLIRGTLSLSFYMQRDLVETKHILNIQSENSYFAVQAMTGVSQVEASKIEHRYKMI